MKIKKEDLQGIMTILTNVDQFKPIVHAFLQALDTYKDELDVIPTKISRWTVSNRIKSIRQYEQAGFTREQAMTMTLSDMSDMRQLVKSLNRSKKQNKSQGQNKIQKQNIP